MSQEDSINLFVKYFCKISPAQIRIRPKKVDANIFSPRIMKRKTRDMNGVIKTRLATLETVVEIFKADCHKTTLIPISKKPIYIEPMSPSIDGVSKEFVK